MIAFEKLTIDEKIRLICGQGVWHTADLNGKIPQLLLCDGPVGLRKVCYDEMTGREYDQKSVAYPSIQVLANTWNKQCAYKMGEAIADDCMDADVDIILAPGVNIKRNPLCGRNFEYFSEDPFLTGALAYEYIKGVQDGGIGVCLKHYYCNNLETNRYELSSDVDERTLREIYLKPFEMACKAKPVSVMCAYNRINGVYASENKKGFRILRDEFGFDGAIISDWSAVRNRTRAAKAGLDLEMPFNQSNYEGLVNDYKEGKITEAEISACAKRVYDFIFRCKKMRKNKKHNNTVAERQKIAEEIAQEGIVLLKNDGVLPISHGASVSVCGKYASPQDDIGLISGGGSSEVPWIGEKFDLPKILRDKFGLTVNYRTVFWENGIITWGAGAGEAFRFAAASDLSIVCVGTGQKYEREGYDRDTLRLPKTQEDIILESVRWNPNTIVIVFAGGPIDMSAWKNKVKAIVYAGFGGEGMGESLANILMGVVNPSGKLSESFPEKLEDSPSFAKYQNACVSRYQEGLDVGYRYYVTYDVPVAFPFGFGLSYSIFEYQDLSLSVANNVLRVNYSIKNNSDREGKEISQIYIKPISPYVYRPRYELKAFSKDLIAPGIKTEITIMLEKEAFSYFSVAKDQWAADDGLYEILVGSSSQDIRLKSLVSIRDGFIYLVEA